MMNKILSVGVVLSGVFLSILINTYHQRKQFFPTLVQLSQATSSYTIMLLLGFYLAVLFGILTQKIFLGPLRVIEIEHLHENWWYSLTEMLLEMTIFRDEFGLVFASFFAIHVYCKVFQWLVKDRIDYMEQTPALDRLFHPRLVSLLLMLFWIDLWVLFFSIGQILLHGPSIMIMFAFEAGLLLVDISSNGCKYLFNVVHMNSQGPWEGRPTLVFYLELVESLLKLCLYLFFFFTLLNFYGLLPLYIMRDLYMTFRSLVLKIHAWIQYRKATRSIEERYPLATPEELYSGDQTCIICREEMTEAKKLYCGHMFHFQCLRSWLERQQTCPTCRRSVLEDQGQPARESAEPSPQLVHPHILSSSVPVVIINEQNQSDEVDDRTLDGLEDLSMEDLELIEGNLRENVVARIRLLSKMKTGISNILRVYSRYEQTLDRVAS